MWVTGAIASTSNRPDRRCTELRQVLRGHGSSANQYSQIAISPEAHGHRKHPSGSTAAGQPPPRQASGSNITCLIFLRLAINSSALGSPFNARAIARRVAS